MDGTETTQYEQPDTTVELEAVFAQSSSFPIRPAKEGYARVWLDVWANEVELAKLLAYHRNEVRMRLTITPDD